MVEAFNVVERKWLGLVPQARELTVREEDWAKLFQLEALNKEEMKEYLNEDPVWLWVLKLWHRGINVALIFLWTQPGQIKYIGEEYCNNQR